MYKALIVLLVVFLGSQSFADTLSSKFTQSTLDEVSQIIALEGWAKSLGSQMAGVDGWACTLGLSLVTHQEGEMGGASIATLSKGSDSKQKDVADIIQRSQDIESRCDKSATGRLTSLYVNRDIKAIFSDANDIARSAVGK